MDAPPADVLAWAATRVGSPVVRVAPMSGGIDAHMFRLSLEAGHDVVLRITRGGDWDDIDHQARILRLLDGTDVPAPRLLAVEHGVGAQAHPVLLQTLLPGDVTLPTEPTDSWLASLVGTICRLQALPLADGLSDRAAARWADVGAVHDWSEAETRIVAGLNRRRPTTPLTRVFVHDDFWIGNTLRDGDDVVGIVDWGQAGVGSAARDATYCAVDMGLCYGLAVGDRFVAMFRDEVDLSDAEVSVWAARAVLMSRHYRSWMTGWTSLGIPVQADEVSARRAELVDRVLSRPD